MIAVTFALPTESSEFRRRLGSASHVRCFHTGVGATATRRAMQRPLQHHPIELLISSGFAGALSNELHVGQIIASQNYSDPAALELTRRLLPDVRLVSLHTAESIIAEPHQRVALGQTGAEAVDMETAIIAEACRERRIPFLSLRVISDSPDEPFPAPPEILFSVEKQRTEFLRIATYLFRHPSSFPRFFRFSGRIAGIRRRLAETLVTLLSAPELRR